MIHSFLRSPLGHIAIAAAAMLGTAFTFGATTAPAYAATAGYQAQLAIPLEGARSEVLNDVAWKCQGDACRGNQGSSRAEVACARLARKLGEVTAFVAGGEALDAEALAKCNGDKARAVARR